MDKYDFSAGRRFTAENFCSVILVRIRPPTEALADPSNISCFVIKEQNIFSVMNI